MITAHGHCIYCVSPQDAKTISRLTVTCSWLSDLEELTVRRGSREHGILPHLESI